MLVLAIHAVLWGVTWASPSGCSTQTDCGVHGHDVGGLQNTNLAACQLGCDEDPECHIFVFKTNTLKCGYKGAGATILRKPGRPAICGKCTGHDYNCGYRNSSVCAHEMLAIQHGLEKAQTDIADLQNTPAPGGDFNCGPKGSTVCAEVEALQQELADVKQDLADLQSAVFAPSPNPGTLPKNGCFEDNLSFTRYEFPAASNVITWVPIPAGKYLTETQCAPVGAPRDNMGAAKLVCVGIKSCNAVTQSETDPTKFLSLSCPPNSIPEGNSASLVAEYVSAWRVTVFGEGSPCTQGCDRLGICNHVRSAFGTQGHCCGSSISYQALDIVNSNATCTIKKQLQYPGAEPNRRLSMRQCLYAYDFEGSCWKDGNGKGRIIMEPQELGPGTLGMLYNCYCALDSCASTTAQAGTRVYQIGQTTNAPSEVQRHVGLRCTVGAIGPILDSGTFATEDECWRFCAERKFCQAAEYDMVTGQCDLRVSCLPTFQGQGGADSLDKVLGFVNDISECPASSMSASPPVIVKPIGITALPPRFANANSADECQKECYSATSPKCEFFNWAASSKTCELISQYHTREKVAGVVSGPDTCYMDAFTCDQRAGANKCPTGWVNPTPIGNTFTHQYINAMTTSFTAGYTPGACGDQYLTGGEDKVLGLQVCNTCLQILRRGDGLYKYQQNFGYRPADDSGEWKLMYKFDENSPTCPNAKIPYGDQARATFETGPYKATVCLIYRTLWSWDDCGMFTILDYFP